MDVSSFFFNQGILGVIIVVLGAVIVLQDRRYRQDLKDRDVNVASLQEKRANDAPIYADKFITTSQTLQNQFKDIVNLEISIQKSIETIVNILQSLKK